jgi:hypothetical protein
MTPRPANYLRHSNSPALKARVECDTTVSTFEQKSDHDSVNRFCTASCDFSASGANPEKYNRAFARVLPLLHAEPGDQTPDRHDHQQPDDAVPLHAHAPLAPYQRDVTVRTIRGCESKINTFFSRVVSSSDIFVSFVVLRRGACSWANHRGRSGFRQIFRLQNSAVKIFGPSGGENSSAPSPSTPIRNRPRSSFAGSRASNMASARFTTGSPVAPMRRPPCCSRSSARFTTERRVA